MKKYLANIAIKEMIKKTVWMEDEEELNFVNKHYLLFSDYNKKYNKHELMKDYKTESIIRFIYGSNKYEGTTQS